MAIIVVGGHSRSVGKTSVVAGLIAAMPERGWLAVKITQFGHGVCSVNGELCDCAVDEHTVAITEERVGPENAGTDTSRFLAAGARRALWVRTKQGRLAEAMPELRGKIAGAENVIMESNSVMRFLKPDIYLTVLDFGVEDFKQSAREFLDLADAIVVSRANAAPKFDVSRKLIEAKPKFKITPPEYVTAELVAWVRKNL
jgi:molybdopterin-guanine dinucleotide biosynthesis protein